MELGQKKGHLVSPYTLGVIGGVLGGVALLALGEPKARGDQIIISPSPDSSRQVIVKKGEGVGLGDERLPKLYELVKQTCGDLRLELGEFNPRTQRIDEIRLITGREDCYQLISKQPKRPLLERLNRLRFW